MKNFTPKFFAITIAFIMNCSAQDGDTSTMKTVLKNAELKMIENTAGDVIVSYHVEERKMTNFGAHITSYKVSHLSLVQTTDLGPNNTRIVTPIYGKAKKKISEPLQMSKEAEVKNPAIPVADEAVNKPAINSEKAEEPIKVGKPVGAAEPVKESGKFVYVNVTDTYERILLKGYKSIDMFKKVADSRYFDGNHAAAAKWYGELFSLTNDLDESYYYRYAVALKSIKEVDKADEIMAMFESKISKNF